MARWLLLPHAASDTQRGKMSRPKYTYIQARSSFYIYDLQVQTAWASHLKDADVPLQGFQMLMKGMQGQALTLFG